jgi:Glycosyl transferase family 2
MPTLTIGIPTFNRANLLASAIEAALNQTHREIELIVCDNASDDGTEEVVRRFEGRLRYVRNDTNLGAWPNFCRLVELASGEYFSWLQDDDCIFAPFAERAVACLENNPQATVYGAYAAVAPNVDCLANGWLYGPPLALDWQGGKPRAIRGDLIAPLSLMVSVAIPPVVAFRTAALKSCLPRCNPAIPLFVERTLLADVASQGEIVLEPYVAGVFRSHAKQIFRVMQSEDAGAKQQQWLQMARQLDTIPLRRNGDWRRRLFEVLSEGSANHRRDWQLESRNWPTDIALCREVRRALIKPQSKTASSRLFEAGKKVARAMFPSVLG